MTNKKEAIEEKQCHDLHSVSYNDNCLLIPQMFNQSFLRYSSNENLRQTDGIKTCLSYMLSSLILERLPNITYSCVGQYK